jgi:hypothetical protein
LDIWAHSWLKGRILGSYFFAGFLAAAFFAGAAALAAGFFAAGFFAGAFIWFVLPLADPLLDAGLEASDSKSVRLQSL